MPATIPTPSINISAAASSNRPHHQQHHSTAAAPPPPLPPQTAAQPSAAAASTSGLLGHTPLSAANSFSSSSPFSAEALAAATALRRPSLVLSVGSFHSAQLRRPSFFAPFPYSQSPQHSDTLIHDYSSSPRRGDVYQRDLEANYCSNFSCCGLTLGDLHALLQHYEESHVRFEEDDDNGHPVPAGFVDDDGWSTSSESTPTSPRTGRHPNNYMKGSSSTSTGNAAAAATVAALTASQQQQQQHQQKLTPLSFLNARKKSNGVSLSDIYAEDPSLAPEDVVSAFPNSILRTAAQAEFSKASKKRDLSAYSTSFDTHSPMAKKISNFPTAATSTAGAASSSVKPNANSAAAVTAAAILNSRNNAHEKSGESSIHGANAKSQEELLSSVTGYLEQAIQQGLLPDVGEVGSAAYLLAAEDLVRKREELVSIMESISKSGSTGVDKPYRCMVNGCDKAYKNPNGLKYHNQHGHCSASGLSDADGPESKPYVCTFLECGKRYKNLNGLKYHIEHSHPNLTAALRAHQSGLTSHPLLLNGAFANNPQAALTLAAALSAVEASPMMMQAINAITASAANNSNASNNNNISNHNSINRTTPPTDHTPDSSPNASPALRPINGGAGANAGMLAPSNLSAYRGGDNNVFSTDVTPMTSPVLSRATLPGLNPLSIQTALATGLVTPSSLSPTHGSAGGAPKSPTGLSQVSTLTAALAAVTVEQQRQQLQQLQHQQQQQQQQQLHLHHQRSVPM
ncbi:hypothetical protein BGZ68_000201 [Mortierella alpina]|nr:hypothetical protein BGZ68_000201 [Mortierella alpina]